MEMLLDLTLSQFLAELASDKAVPGGGSASALAGAAAGSLVQMVARISLRQADSTELHSALAEAEELTAKLSALIQRDADAFAQVIQALRMSKGTPAERAERSRAIEAAYQGAAAVPLEVMEVAVRMLAIAEAVAEHCALAIAEAVAEHCAASAISDVCVAGQLSWAAVQGAAYNVKINLPGIKDQAYVEAAQTRMEELLYAADQRKLNVEKCLCQRADAR